MAGSNSQQGVQQISPSINIPALRVSLGLDQPAAASRHMSGAQTSSGFTVGYYLSKAAPTSVAVSLNADMSAPALVTPETTPVGRSSTSGTLYPVLKTIAGLQPAKTYYYQALVNGTPSGPICKCKTWPIAGSVAPYRLNILSCIVPTWIGPDVFAAMAADDPLMVMNLGDWDYPDITVNDLGYIRTRGPYAGRGFRYVDHLLTGVGQVYTYDDHDAWGGDNNHWDVTGTDSATFAQGMASVRASIREAVPMHPTVQDGLGWTNIDTNILARQFDIGRVRHILLDDRAQRRVSDPAGSAPTMLGHNSGHEFWDQTSWFLTALTQAASDGRKLVVVYASSELAPSTNDGWFLAPAERTAIWDFARTVGVALVMVCGDAHVLFVDDGSTTDFSTTQDVRLPMICSSGAYQPDAVNRPLVAGLYAGARWNGQSGLASGNGNACGYALFDVFDNGGSDVKWQLTFKGAPIVNGAATTLGTFRSDDIPVTVGFLGGSTLRVASGDTATMTVRRTGMSVVDGCTVDWSGPNGTSGTLTFAPNCIQATIPNAVNGTYTLANPVRCSLGSASSQTVATYTPETETTNYLAAMTVKPSTVQKAAINDFIAGAKADGWYSSVSHMYWLGAHHEQAGRVCMKTPGTNTLTPVLASGAASGASHTPLKGWNGNGTGALDTGYAVPAANQNSIAMFVWSLDVAANASGDMGADNYLINARTASTATPRMRCSSGTTNTVGSAIGGAGEFGFSRTASTGYTAYQDGQSIGAVTQASGAPTALPIWLCGFNNASPQYGGRTEAFGMIASGLTAAQVAARNARVKTLLQAMGTVA